MKFKEWLKLQEVGTSTSCVAVFSLPMFGGGMVDRVWPSLIAGDEEKHKKHRKHKKKKKD